MSLREKFTENMKDAMRAKDEITLSTFEPFGTITANPIPMFNLVYIFLVENPDSSCINLNIS